MYAPCGKTQKGMASLAGITVPMLAKKVKPAE